jgi:AcrR family transcriptional regulator
MPRLVDSIYRRQELADTVTRLVAEGGIAAVTMRSVAAELRMSLAALAHHLSRAEMLALAATEHGAALVDRIEEQPPERRLESFLPVECRREPGQETFDPAGDVDPFATFRPYGVLQMRVWLTWCVLAQTDADLAGVVEQVRQRQLWVLRGASAAPGIEQVEQLLAVIEGLRLACCRTIDPLPLDVARQALASFERTFVQSVGGRSPGA